MDSSVHQVKNFQSYKVCTDSKMCLLTESLLIDRIWSEATSEDLEPFQYQLL